MTTHTLDRGSSGPQASAKRRAPDDDDASLRAPTPLFPSDLPLRFFRRFRNLADRMGGDNAAALLRAELMEEGR